MTDDHNNAVETLTEEAQQLFDALDLRRTKVLDDLKYNYPYPNNVAKDLRPTLLGICAVLDGVRCLLDEVEYDIERAASGQRDVRDVAEAVRNGGVGPGGIRYDDVAAVLLEREGENVSYHTLAKLLGCRLKDAAELANDMLLSRYSVSLNTGPIGFITLEDHTKDEETQGDRPV